MNFFFFKINFKEKNMQDITGTINKEGKTIPHGRLDRVVSLEPIENITQYNLFTGTTDFSDFYEQYKKIVLAEEYPTIDHIPFSIEISNIYYIYISLDNSVRANMAGFPLYERINNICELINNIINKNNIEKYVIFFSESCRISFLGSMQEKKNIVNWLTIRNIISEKCNINFIIEKRNNEAEMSFGVSAFCSKNIIDDISYKCHDLYKLENTGCFGSGAVQISCLGANVIGIHFPLDFKGELKNNYTYETMKNLLAILKKENAVAIGDINYIPLKNPQYAIELALEEFGGYINEPQYNTFFGAYFDTI